MKLVNMETHKEEHVASSESDSINMDTKVPGYTDETQVDEEYIGCDEVDDVFVPSPLVPLQEQIEKDKDDVSLRRWKEQLLGAVALDDQRDPEVKFHSIGIVSDALEEITAPLPTECVWQKVFQRIC